jgi:hypothetical protein
MTEIRSELKCMDSSGCAASFSETEVRRFLDLKTFEGFENLRTENEIRDVCIYRDSN